MPNDDYPLTLLCHPATPATVVRTLEAQSVFLPDGSLALAYRLWGDIARLRIPEELAPERTDLLWEHTCFEAFVGVRGEAAYREYNFSPSGQWGSYAFTDYRQPDANPADIEPPRITARRFAGRLELDAAIPGRSLPPNPRHAPWQIGLSAVVEAADTVDGSHSYWALLHPARQPDFHHRAAFTLILHNGF